MKALLKYPGAKWSIKPSRIETINDLDENVTIFFECVREDPERLARMIYDTPYSRKVYEEAFFRIYREKGFRDKFEHAFYFCICLNMGRGFRTNGERTGWRIDVAGPEKAYAARDWAVLPEKIVACTERLRSVQIENRPAVELIKAFQSPKVLLYADPPYLIDTRKRKSGQYLYEMDEAEHEELA